MDITSKSSEVSTSFSQLSLFSSVSTGVQESTMQVPCGVHSIFDPSYYVPEFCRAVYLVVNECSNWDSGISHALSNRRIADLLNVRHREQVNRALSWLIDAGWLCVEGKRSDGTFFYRVVHHNCAVEDIPLDKHGRPLKCAVPRGEGSATACLAAGEITWREMVQWFVYKVACSDWVTGIVESTVGETSKLVRFGLQTICDNAKKLGECGLLHRLSAKFQASVFQLFPKPYPERKERAEYKEPKPLPRIKDWYYSFNKRWRFHADTLRLMMQELGGRWRDANMEELLGINPKIHRDFMYYMSALRPAWLDQWRGDLASSGTQV